MTQIIRSNMKRFILFLIRKRLGLKKYEHFRFANQKTNAEYYFTEYNVMKTHSGWTQLSHVSVNWILDDDCEIEKV